MIAVIIILFMYLVGAVLAYGFYTGVMYSLDEDAIDTVRPSHKHPYDDKFVCIAAIMSWIGVAACWIWSIGNDYKPRLKYSYTKLWDKWEDISM